MTGPSIANNILLWFICTSIRECAYLYRYLYLSISIASTLAVIFYFQSLFSKAAIFSIPLDIYAYENVNFSFRMHTRVTYEIISVMWIKIFSRPREKSPYPSYLFDNSRSETIYVVGVWLKIIYLQVVDIIIITIIHL